MKATLKISLIVPVYNESSAIADLISSIRAQTFQPDEIIIVDGGSTDNTAKIIENFCDSTPGLKLIKAGRAMPGEGRNIGAASVTNEWIAFTDAGVTQKKDWLENLVKKAKQNPEAEIIYGNVSPRTNNFFEECAAIAYMPPLKSGIIRAKSIATCLLRKNVWEMVGGFPDFRAAEDLIFIENVEKAGFKTAYCYEAMIYWHLRPDLISTFKKFVLYSKHNVWAGRQSGWHYGVLKQYLFVAFFVTLGVLYNPLWLLLLPVWLFARIFKRIYSHKYEYGLKALKKPHYFLAIAGITIIIDIATFIGWGQALFSKPQKKI